jgi:hypothetical protein
MRGVQGRPGAPFHKWGGGEIDGLQLARGAFVIPFGLLPTAFDLDGRMIDYLY